MYGLQVTVTLHLLDRDVRKETYALILEDFAEISLDAVAESISYFRFFICH